MFKMLVSFSQKKKKMWTLKAVQIYIKCLVCRKRLHMSSSVRRYKGCAILPEWMWKIQFLVEWEEPNGCLKSCIWDVGWELNFERQAGMRCGNREEGSYFMLLTIWLCHQVLGTRRGIMCTDVALFSVVGHGQGT